MNTYLKSTLAVLCLISICSLVQAQLSILPQAEYATYHIEELVVDHHKLIPQANKKAKSSMSIEIFGQQHVLILEPTDVMSPELAKAWPSISTYKITSTDQAITGRATLYGQGTFIQIHTDQGMVAINPKTYKSDLVHKVEIGKNSEIHTPPCQLRHDETQPLHNQSDFTFKRGTVSNGSVKRTYTIAITTPYEFYTTTGSSEEANIAGVVATVNALEEVYENELAVNFTLLPPVIFTSEDDPFDPNLGSFTEDFGQAILDNYDLDEFDVAHFLGPIATYGGGGYAALGALCDNELKTVGFTAGYDGIYFDYVNTFAHEVGHQFGANHTFNGNGGGCSTDNLSPFTSVEIGSGSTVMSYNGLCSNIQNTNRASNHFFHTNSVREILVHLDRVENRCTQLIEEESGNQPPVVDINECGSSSLVVPISTPFMLAGGSVDEGVSRSITYGWEQADEGGFSGHGLIGEAASMSASGPLFETFNPSSLSFRLFPDVRFTISSQENDFQNLPAVPRTMNFNMVARDNNPGAGAMTIEDVEIDVSEFGPFTLDSLSTTNLNLDDELTLFWSTNGTEDFCENLGIWLSLNNGLSFDYQLAEGITYADGQATIVIPHNVPRVTFSLMMLGCDDYTCFRFYDLYDAPVRINTSCPARASAICDDSPISAQAGSNDLNLEIEILLGNNYYIFSESSCRQPSNLGTVQGYAFIAVQNGTNVIRAVSEFGDFTNVQTGEYTIYGVSYKVDGASPPASLDPSDWIGSNLSDVVSSENCAFLSNNSIPMSIGGEGVNCSILYENGPTELGFRPQRCLFSPQSLDNIRDSEAYVIKNLVPKRKYIFSFCENYDELDFEANVVIMEYDNDSGAIGDILYDQLGCTHNIALDEDTDFTDILIIITDSQDCMPTSQGVDFGQPKFICEIGRNLEETQEEVIINRLVQSDIFIYPNPAQDVLQIDGLSIDDFVVTVTDVTGKILSTHNNMRKIQVSDYANGVYLLNIMDSTGTQEWVKKFSIVR